MACKKFSAFCRKASAGTTDVDFCFAEHLGADETIQFVGLSHTAGIQVQNISRDTESVVVRVRGGTPGLTYTVCARAQTSSGQVFRQCALIAVYQCADNLVEAAPVTNLPDITITSSAHFLTVSGGKLGVSASLGANHQFYTALKRAKITGGHAFLTPDGNHNIISSHGFTTNGALSDSTTTTSAHALTTGGGAHWPGNASVGSSHALTTVGTHPADATVTSSHAFTTTGSLIGGADAWLWENGDTHIWENADTAIWE